ncbi:MAG: response regulator [Polyangiaceae bacterium]|nr:response regulator [Polyangiaceae bacterium]
MSGGWKEFRKTGKLTEEENIKKLGLLVVDDEAEIVASLRETFSRHFDIYHATSASDALEMFKQHQPRLVISDQRMPEMTGIELLSRIKNINPSTVRILLTGYSDINVVIEALNDDLLWKYVAKPWDYEKLKAMLLEAARRCIKEDGASAEEYGFNAGFLGM